MKIIFGLGNPGPLYANTRHNCGFLALDKLAEILQTDFGKKIEDNLIATAFYADRRLILAKPQLYMNLSGFPLARLCRYFKVNYQDILVVHDDLALPPAILRLRRNGSDGGLNGMKSIIEQAGTQEINRLKIGIGPALFDAADYVTGRFTNEEIPQFAQAFALATESVLCWVKEGIGAAMNKFNRRDQAEV